MCVWAGRNWRSTGSVAKVTSAIGNRHGTFFSLKNNNFINLKRTMQPSLLLLQRIFPSVAYP